MEVVLAMVKCGMWFTYYYFLKAFYKQMYLGHMHPRLSRRL
jgi:hypothetical protein